jgi:hypothetical protein
MKKILLVFTLLVTLVACSGPAPEQTQQVVQNPKGPEKGYAEILVNYKIKHSDTRVWAEKIRIDDHDYLMFGSGLANPPTVIHSENCPCKQTAKQ